SAETPKTPKTIPAAKGWSDVVRAGISRVTQVPAVLEIAFRPDPTVGDGTFSENAWLQELPKPLTKLTWDNAALLSPATAKSLGVGDRDEVELEYRGRRIQAAAWISPGHADDSVTLALGYGRRHENPIAKGLGYNAYALRTGDAPWQDRGLTVRKTGGTTRLACTQDHHGMEGRNPARTESLAAFARRTGAAHAGEKSQSAEAPQAAETLPSLYPAYKYPGHAWGMAIDLSLCTGCSSCVVACQAENNIPVVGRDQVARGREMHWIRVDAYFQGIPENPGTVFQPVPCMHCENAPCELVCPVEATVHDSEGLNAMVYNRCVGTRYCSNNCPYKVRRFNFLQYADLRAESLKLMRNPEVTVRSRGVMEKCTYCVQRIESARIDAEIGDRNIRDGDVVTACAQACPTGAIVFGDINDAGSAVAARKRSPRNYALLEELNTRPRTTYLSRIRNPPDGTAADGLAAEASAVKGSVAEGSVS
ncbi:MAG: molybdopterin oxidoreductase, iron-sulfur binding subunit, partial [Fibrobacteres bacterium]|nr:molybdopterin oxidoreductase, iron-sulfur binding subunit [Fibrobacterota bacterium]